MQRCGIFFSFLEGKMETGYYRKAFFSLLQNSRLDLDSVDCLASIFSKVKNMMPFQLFPIFS